MGKHEKQLPPHVAKKKIPFTDLVTGNAVKPTQTNGIKLEKFVFDVFEFSENFVVWECHRNDEFSPLKNGAAGANVDGPSDQAVEISPLVSYAGEGLDAFKGKSLTAPFSINKDGVLNETT